MPANRNIPHQAAFTIQGRLRAVGPEIEEFKSRHRHWFAAHGGDSPIYQLPRATTAALRHPRPHKPPILQDEDAAAELDFASLCERLHSLGVWNGQMLSYSYLMPRVPLPDEANMRRFGYSNALIVQCRQAELAVGDAERRLKGYAGWLVCEPQFLSERDALKGSWQMLPPVQRPSFPLQRSVTFSEHPSEAHPAEPELATLQRAINSFLDRWGLTRMAAWELPDPQGPLLPALLPPNSPAMPRHGLHIVLPVHYPLTGNDDLLRRIRQQQIALARQNHLDVSLAGLPHYDVWAQVLEVEHLERTIRSRYGRRGQRGGFVTAMEAAIAAALSVRVDHIKRLRKGISACKRGRRSSVRWLRSPADASA